MKLGIRSIVLFGIWFISSSTKYIFTYRTSFITCKLRSGTEARWLQERSAASIVRRLTEVIVHDDMNVFDGKVLFRAHYHLHPSIEQLTLFGANL